MSKVKIHAKCETCGDFTVVRKSIMRKSTSGGQYESKNVVCPNCRMWGLIVRVEEVGRA